MAGDFEEVRRKFRWANHQLFTLDLAVADYVSTEPYVTVLEDHPEAKEWREIARLRYPPPPALANIVGDLLNNLHGVLDYLAWQLAHREGGTPDHTSVFPLEKTMQADGSEPNVNVFRQGKSRKQRIPLIDDPYVLDALRFVQPYKNGDLFETHPLQVLRTLNGKSKHAYPVLMASGARLPRVQHVAPQTFGFPHPLRRVQDGDEVAACLYEWLPDGEPPKQTKLTTEVWLEQWPHHPRTQAPLSVMAVMQSILNYIGELVIPPFIGVFEDPPRYAEWPPPHLVPKPGEEPQDESRQEAVDP